jgi:hypothetical protein
VARQAAFAAAPDPRPAGPERPAKGPAIMDPLPYGSHMCSIPDARLALIGQAIDELAKEARTGTQAAGAEGAATEHVMQRLAEIWAMVAELDPGLAQRLPKYSAPAD